MDTGPTTDDASAPTDAGVTDEERAALHDLQLGIECIYQAYGKLLEFHHTLGHGLDHLDDAESALREAGHTSLADRLRDEHLPAGAIGDKWTFELVEAFETGFLDDVTAVEHDIRDELADGQGHIAERRQQRAWRDRAASDPPE